MSTDFRHPDTVLVCRSGQFKETALVLSCFPAGNPPPLFVMDPPPCTEQDYSELYESYRAMRNLRDEASGTEAARQNTLDTGNFEGWSNEEIDHRIMALSPFRLWVRRQRQMSQLLKELPIRKALFLFKATERDMSVIEAVPIDWLSDVRQPLLPEGIEWITLLPEEAGAELVNRAWQTIRPGEALPTTQIAVTDDTISVIAGLYRALQASVLLRISPDPAPRPSSAIVTGLSPSVEETVLVEAADDPAKLAAVHYALRQGATMCVTGSPDLAPIEEARSAIQSAQENKLPNAADLLAAMEASVSAVVPDTVIQAVGGSSLTAFTSAVPYHFVKKPGVDWSRKPIGLMMGDALLLCSIELFGKPAKSPARFNLLFDVGAFQTDETAGVLEEMKKVNTFPLLFQGPAASNTALLAVGPVPLDLLYFNTHGSDESIVLKDMPLPAYKLLQRLTLQGHPVVFNNSCLSWTGVGREFILTGARGYLGTLWSVNAQQAATFAIAVMGRIIAGQQAIASCLTDTGADPLTERAYVFVGPVGARLRAGDELPDGDRARIRSAAAILLQMANYLCASGPQPDSPLTGPVIQVLRKDALALCDELDHRWPEPDADRLNLIVDELDLANHLPFDKQNEAFSTALCMRGLQMADQIDRKSNPERQIRLAFFQRCSRVWHKSGRTQQAIGLLALAAKEREEAGESAGPEYLEISDILRAHSEIDGALKAALQARESFARPGVEQAAPGRMRANGRLAQLYRMTGKLDEAATAARDGYQAAVGLDNLGEQALFRMDQCRIAVLQGRFTDAVSAAGDALKIVRRSHDEDQEVSAYGTLTVALIASKEWDRAEQSATDGMKLALKRNLHQQTADFYVDLSNIDRGKGNLESALARLKDSGDEYAISPDTNKIRNALQKAGMLVAQLNTWEAHRQALCFIAKIMGALEGSDRVSLCTDTVNSILHRIQRDGWQSAQDPLGRISVDIEQVVSQQGKNAPGQLAFIRDVVSACHARSKGLLGEALEIAKRLDEISQHGFHLADAVK